MIAWGLITLFAVAGCTGSDKTAKEIRTYRGAGQLDSARTATLTALGANARSKTIWLELVRLDIDLAHACGEDNAQALPYLVEAVLTCGATFEKERGWPNGSWKEAAQRLSNELGRQQTLVMREFGDQANAAQDLETMPARLGPDTANSEEYRAARDQVDNYRVYGRELIERAMLIQQLGVQVPGSATARQPVLRQQMEAVIEQWTTALGIETDYVSPVDDAVRARLKAAMSRASDDIKDLGYFLPETIIQNGVYE